MCRISNIRICLYTHIYVRVNTFASVRFIFTVRQFRVTIATHCRALTRFVNVRHKPQMSEQNFVSKCRVNSMNTDTILICNILCNGKDLPFIVLCMLIPLILLGWKQEVSPRDW
jgi:hypothetical protein